MFAPRWYRNCAIMATSPFWSGASINRMAVFFMLRRYQNGTAKHSLANQKRSIMFLRSPMFRLSRRRRKVNASLENTRTDISRSLRLLTGMRASGASARAALAVATLLILGPGWIERADDHYFTPTNRLTAIGVDRENMSQLLLEERTRLMIESQTFAILRDPQALTGAQRVTSPRMQKIIDKAADRSGVPGTVISAIAYLESWGDPYAHSYAGPKGIMQISEATARRMGLRQIYKTRYRVATVRRPIRRRHGKVIYKTVRVKTPYTVLDRDERFNPERAIPAAAMYLADMEERYGGLDWAIWAYHCGEGCINDVRDIVHRSNGLPSNASVAQVFFGASPAWNRDLYDQLQSEMERDYSPTYWFRIKRAEQLLALYREDPAEFERLRDDYRNEYADNQRAPNRLAVWVKPTDLLYKTCEDIVRDHGTKLFPAMDNPAWYGFSLRRSGAGALGEFDIADHRSNYEQATPSALGTLLTIAFETRRLHEAMKNRHEQFVPIEVTGLVRPLEYGTMAGHSFRTGKGRFDALCSGQAFAISLANLPPGEREALQFVLNDIGWLGYLSFVDESSASGSLVIGCSPTSRDFFTKVYEEAVSHDKDKTLSVSD